jgi:hypothetical protein
MPKQDENIKTERQQIVWGGGVEWTDLAQDRYQWRALICAVMKLRVP